MATGQLKLYNGALTVLGERKLASLAENREPRRVLDTFWDDDAIRYLLGRGLWNFAMRTLRIDYDSGIEPDFGYRRAFPKPDDWVRTAALCSDEYFRSPLTECADEQGYWFADLDQIYVKIVSDDGDYGGDYSLWPTNFTIYAEHWLAWRACNRITQSKTLKADIERDMKRLLAEARATDAMNEPAGVPPAGGWTSARRGGGRGDRAGARLIG